MTMTSLPSIEMRWKRQRTSGRSRRAGTASSSAMTSSGYPCPEGVPSSSTPNRTVPPSALAKAAMYSARTSRAWRRSSVCRDPSDWSQRDLNSRNWPSSRSSRERNSGSLKRISSAVLIPAPRRRRLVYPRVRAGRSWLRFRRPPDGGDDPAVRAAAADVPLHGALDVVVLRVLVLLEEGHGGHDHARGAVGALEGLRVEEGLLDGVEAACRLEPFDGGDRLAGGFGEVGDATSSGLAIDEDGARAALAFAAAVFGAGEVELVAEDCEEASDRLFGDLVDGAVDAKVDGVRHRRLLCAS